MKPLKMIAGLLLIPPLGWIAAISSMIAMGEIEYYWPPVGIKHTSNAWEFPTMAGTFGRCGQFAPTRRSCGWGGCPGDRMVLALLEESEKGDMIKTFLFVCLLALTGCSRYQGVQEAPHKPAPVALRAGQGKIISCGYSKANRVTTLDVELPDGPHRVSRTGWSALDFCDSVIQWQLGTDYNPDKPWAMIRRKDGKLLIGGLKWVIK